MRKTFPPCNYWPTLSENPVVSRYSVSALNLISALAMCAAGDVENKIEGRSCFRILFLQMCIITNVHKNVQNYLVSLKPAKPAANRIPRGSVIFGSFDFDDDKKLTQDELVPRDVLQAYADLIVHIWPSCHSHNQRSGRPIYRHNMRSCHAYWRCSGLSSPECKIRRFC